MRRWDATTDSMDTESEPAPGVGGGGRVGTTE